MARDELLTRAEVARVFQVDESAVQGWVDRKVPVLTEIGTDAGPRYKRSEVEALLERKFHGGSPDHE
jgi:hypothetical protein